MPREPIRRAIDGCALVLVQGDITRQRVDAIVNAANSRLVGGGGVDGAIRRAAGPALEEECARIRAEQGGCPTGSAVITGAGRLAARYVIHAVGPVWYGGRQGEADLLAAAYRASLRLAADHGARTVAFPSISTGVYGYPVSLAARVALRAVIEGVQGTSLDEVRFVLFSEPDFDAYAAALEEVLGPMRQEPSLEDRPDLVSQEAAAQTAPEPAGFGSAEPAAVTGGADHGATSETPMGPGGGGRQPEEPLWQTTPPEAAETAPGGDVAAPAGPRPRARARATPAKRAKRGRKPAAKARRRTATGRGGRRSATRGRRAAPRRRAGGRGGGRPQRRAAGRAVRLGRRPGGRTGRRVRPRGRAATTRRRGRVRRIGRGRT